MHLLSQIRHQNLVSFEGFCYEPKRQILVYEYLSGGSLADHLYGMKILKYLAILIIFLQNHLPRKAIAVGDILLLQVHVAKGIH